MASCCMYMILVAEIADLRGQQAEVVADNKQFIWCRCAALGISWLTDGTQEAGLSMVCVIEPKYASMYLRRIQGGFCYGKKRKCRKIMASRLCVAGAVV